MPKIKPLGESARLRARWTAANENFDRQVGRLLGEARLTGTKLAEMIGVNRVTLANWRKDCSKMPIEAERKLITIFEKYGVPYDRTLGEGLSA